MAVYTKITSRDIKSIQKNFDIGKITNFKGIKKGIENTNYVIKSNKKRYILTIFEKRVKTKDLPFFMNLMSGLAKLNIKCPEPIKNKKGEYIFYVKGKSACIVSFLKGKDKKKLTGKECYIVGKSIAKLHLASRKLRIYRKNSLSISYLKPIIKKIGRKIEHLNKNLMHLMQIEMNNIKKNWPKKLPTGIIHSDLFIDNIFFYKNKFFGFIDFYFSANDFLAYELATCINALCFDKRKKGFIFNSSKSSNLLKGYQSIRILTKNEKKYFNILCRGSALRYLTTRSYDYLNTPKSAIIKIKDPLEYYQKLLFHKKISLFKEYLN